MDKYIVRECTSDDYQTIADFFNNNEAYQVDNYPLTYEDISISFELKEIRHFYGLFLNDKLVGTTALFHFIFEAVHYNDSIFSGFLLIDPSLRDGSAIRNLFLTLQKNSNIVGNKSYFCEINLENKASLQLSKLNGYTLFNKSWEDSCHYILFRSDLSKLKKVTNQFIGKKNKESYKFKKSYWKNGSYFASFYSNDNDDEVNFGINSDNPWFIKSSRFKIYFKNNYLHWTFNANSSVKRLLFEFGDESYSTNDLNSFLKLDNSFKSVHVTMFMEQDKIFRHYYLDNKGIYDIDDSVISIKLSDLNVPFTSININKNNGDIIYKIGDEQVISDVFPRTDSSLKSDVKISFKEDTLDIFVTNEVSKIKKTVFFKNNIISNRIKFYCKSTLISKYGIRILHKNYFLAKDNETSKFYAYQLSENINLNNPKENMDFAKMGLFNLKDKYYYLPEYNMRFIVSSTELSSNQMTYRPLIISKFGKGNVDHTSSYTISFDKLMDFMPLDINDKLKNYNKYKLRIRKILRRSEKNDLSAFTSTLVNVPREVDYTFSDDVIEVERSSGLYTGLYFNFKMQGNIFVKDDLRYLKLFENGEWIEFNNQLMIINESKKNYFKFESLGNRLFIYKKHNTIYMRIISRNNSKNKIKINTRGIKND